MIAQNTLRLEHKAGNQPPLYLAPFGEQELDAVFPLPIEGLHLEEGYLRQLADDLATSRIITSEQRKSHNLEWGIYCEEISPERFIGTVGVRQVLQGEPKNLQHTTSIQETGTFIMRSTERGKGIGSLAKLAVVTYVLNKDKPRILQAHTSEYNTPSQGSLFKVGFTYIDLYGAYDFPNDGLSQQWLLVPPGNQEAVARDDAECDALKAGWQRYEAQMQTLSLTEIDAKTNF